MEQLFFPVTRREAERQGIPFSSVKNKKAHFPSQLRELRKGKGISQAALAKTLGVSKSTVGLWETGDTLPDAKSVYELAVYFEVSADWLLGLSDSREAVSRFPVINRMVLEYALALDKLALEVEQKGVDDVLLYETIGDSLIPEYVTDSWRAAVKRCQWVLDHVDAFRDENGVYNGSDLLYILNGK